MGKDSESIPSCNLNRNSVLKRLTSQQSLEFWLTGTRTLEPLALSLFQDSMFQTSRSRHAVFCFTLPSSCDLAHHGTSRPLLLLFLCACNRRMRRIALLVLISFPFAYSQTSVLTHPAVDNVLSSPRLQKRNPSCIVIIRSRLKLSAHSQDCMYHRSEALSFLFYCQS
jgi:hypothetical protein